jgi:hypothetical protein
MSVRLNLGCGAARVYCRIEAREVAASGAFTAPFDAPVPELHRVVVGNRG